jgi:hypothetical protein
VVPAEDLCRLSEFSSEGVNAEGAVVGVDSDANATIAELLDGMRSEVCHGAGLHVLRRQTRYPTGVHPANIWPRWIDAL